MILSQLIACLLIISLRAAVLLCVCTSWVLAVIDATLLILTARQRSGTE